MVHRLATVATTQRRKDAWRGGFAYASSYRLVLRQNLFYHTSCHVCQAIVSAGVPVG